MTDPNKPNKDNKEPGIIPPQRGKRSEQPAVNEPPAEDEITPNMPVVGSDDGSHRPINPARYVTLDFDSKGRLGGVEPVMNFEVYDMDSIHDFSMMNADTIIDTVANAVERCSETKMNISEVLVSDFTEITRGIRVHFYDKMIKHRWFHSKCQNKYPEDERKQSTTDINAATINTRTIEEADAALQKWMAERLKEMSPEQRKKYIEAKYPEDASDRTDAELLADVKVTDNMAAMVPSRDGDGYDKVVFGYMRMGHWISGQHKAVIAYSEDLKALRRRLRPQSTPMSEWKAHLEWEASKLRRTRDKDTMVFAKALTIKSVNGKTLSDKEKIAYYRTMPSTAMDTLSGLMDLTHIGIDDERLLECDLCGESERRSLHRQISPYDFLPTGNASGISSERPAAPLVFFE